MSASTAAKMYRKRQIDRAAGQNLNEYHQDFGRASAIVKSSASRVLANWIAARENGATEFWPRVCPLSAILIELSHTDMCH